MNRERTARARRVIFEQMERRVLLSADPLLDALEDRAFDTEVVADSSHDAGLGPAASGISNSLVNNQTVEPDDAHRTTEVYFIDSRVPDALTLVEDLRDRAGEGIEFVLLDARQSGIDQVSDMLADVRNLDAVHIVSHASQGAVQIGSTNLDSASLEKNTDAVRSWGKAFAENGDLLFYGCDLAAGTEGETLVNRLAELTGTDVSASIDATGNADKGGDWELEYHSGTIETPIGFDLTIQDAFSGILAPNVPPTVSATPADPAYTEGGEAADPFDAVSIDAVEGGQTIDEIVLTVTNVSDGANETLNIDGTAVVLTNANSGSTATNGYGYAVNLTGGAATVTLTTTGATAASAEVVVDTLSYENTGSPPTVADRVVTLLSVKDSGGTGGGGNDTATPNFASAVKVSASGPALWLSTDSNVVAPGADGLPSGWTEGQVLALGGPDLALGDPTDGDLSSVIDFDNFTLDAVDAGALHFVSRDMSVGGGANTFDLKMGDVLVSFLQDETILAAYTSSGLNEFYSDRDLLVFRPAGFDDYSTGTFYLLLDEVVVDDLKGVTLVEQDTMIGVAPISAGSFLIIQETSTTTSIDLFEPTGVGAGTTSGTTTPLIDLSDLGIDADSLRGIELIESDTSVGGQSLSAGSLLVTLNVDDNVSGVGSNNLLVDMQDVFALNLTATGLGTTAGTAAMVLDGSDVQLDGTGGAESPYALALKNYSQLTVDTMGDVADGDTSSLVALLRNKGADGKISLREAIEAANATPNGDITDTIAFDITDPLVGGAQTINLSSALPSITDAVTIDGWSEPDFVGTPVVRIDGASAGGSVDGLSLSATADGSIIRGLMITDFSRDGILVQSGADDVTIAGNWIGTSGTGSMGVGNSDDGIDLRGANATIGGTGPNDRNVVTNSGDEGIDIVGTGVTGHVIQGNYIGLDPDGSTGTGNTDVGIAIITGSGNTIGGTTAAARNAISNNYEGMEINTDNNVVQGNYVGTDAGGTLDRGNRFDDGIEIQSGAIGNLVGGTAAGAGNLIAFNALAGVNVFSGTGNSVLGNEVHSNSGLGINLGTAGVTANDTDPDDVDSGANNLQNFPVIASAELSGTDMTLSGSLDTDGISKQYRIEFFGNAAGTQDVSNGEGRYYLGATTVTTDGSGDAAFSNVTLSGITLGVGDYVTATATFIDAPAQVGVNDALAYGDTSEFAQNVAVAAAANSAPVANDDPGDFVADLLALSPVSYWRLGDMSGPAADLGSSGNAGTYHGGTLGQTGAIVDGSDTAVRFDAGSSEYVEIAHSGDYLLDDGTVQLWFNVDTAATGDLQHLFSKDALGFGTGGHLSIYINASGNLEVRLQSASASYVVNSPAAVTEGQWHHVAFSFGADGMALYLDGQIVDTDGYTGGLGTTSGGAGNFEPIAIGGGTQTSGNLVTATVDQFFTGLIDEFAIVGSQLNAETIRELYGAGLQNFKTDEDTTLNVAATAGVLVNDFDVDSDPLTVIEVNGSALDVGAPLILVSGAQVTLNADGSMVYDPNGQFENLGEGQTATDTFSYTANDGNSDSIPATVTITITGVNDPPTVSATPTNPTFTEGGGAADLFGAVSIGTVESGQSIDEIVLTVSNVADGADEIINIDGTAVALTNANSGSTATNGYGYTVALAGNTATVVLTTTGATPAAAQTLIDTLSYQNNAGPPTVANRVVTLLSVRDSGGNANGGNDTTTPSMAATVSIDIVPSAGNDSFSTTEDTAVTTGNVLTNDNLGDVPTTITAFDATSVNGGTVVNNGDGTFTYTPATDFNGSDSFTYTITDVDGDASTATVTITVSAVNDVPSAVNDSYTVDEDGSLVTSEWQYQRVLTFDNTGQTENLTDFPVLIKLDNTRINYAATQDNGEDLRFFDSTGTQLLTHEIEVWDESGISYVWVKVPLIDAASGADSITMVYGNANAADGQDPEGVWGSDYDLVYHLNDDTGLTGGINDSSASSFDGTNQGSINSVGVAGDAQDFDGTTYIDIGSDLPILNGATAVTLSAWINPDAVNGLVGTQQLVSFSIDAGGPTPSSRVAIALSGNELGVLVRPFDNATEQHMLWTTGGPLVKGAWQQVTATVDIPNDSIEVYVDGVLQTLSGPVNFPTATAFLSANSSISAIGGEDDGSGSFFVGKMDEVRLSTTARSADWLAAQAQAVTDGGFVAFGAEQAVTRAMGVLVNDTDAENAITAVLVNDVSDGSLTLNPNGSFTYTPTGDFNGVDSFTYRANDGTLDSALATVTITVTNVDDGLPVATDDAGAGFNTSEDVIGFVTGNVLSNDTLSDHAAITAFDATSAQGGTVVDNGNGTFTYTPVADFNGSDTFTYTLTDDEGQQATATVTINVTNVDDSPIARPDGVHLSFDGDDFVRIVDAPSLQMTATVTMEAWINHSGGGTGSQLILNKEGEYELGVTADTGEIKFAIADAGGTWNWHNTGYFITVGEWTHVAVTYDGMAGEAKTYVNGALVETHAQSGVIGDVYPGFNDLFIGGRENASTQRFQGQIDEVRVWSTARSQGEIQSSMYGSLTGVEPGLAGNWRLDEAAGGTVIDQSPFGNDGILGGGEGAAAAPAYQGYLTNENTLFTIPAGSGVLANDLDVDSGSLTVTNVDTTGMFGSLVMNTADGSFTYDPRGVFEHLAFGEQITETFTYTANDGFSDSNTATVSITVTGVNDSPTVSVTATNPTFTEGGAAADLFNAVSIGTGESGQNIDQIALTIDNVTDGADEVLNVDGTAVALSNGNSGTTTNNSYDYTVALAGNTATVVLSTTGATPAAAETVIDTLSYQNNGSPPTTSNRVVTLISVRDGGGTADGGSDSAVLSIASTVSVDLVPTAVDDTNTAAEAGPAVAGNVITNDTPGDAPTIVTAANQGGNAITIGSAFATSGGGSLTLHSNGSYTYMPPSLGAVPPGGLTEVFSYTITDDDGDTSSATLTVTVSENDLTPSAINDTDTATEAGVAVGGNVITNDTPGDGPTTVTAANQAGNTITVGSTFSTSAGGSLTLNGNGSYTYTPPAQGSVPPGGLSEVFNYTITDADGDTSSATLTITVNDNDLTPSAANDTDTATEAGVDATGNVITNDTQGDAPATVTVADQGGNAITLGSAFATAGGGSLTLNSNGSYTYTPPAQGSVPPGGLSEVFNYTITDADGDTSSATLTITVNDNDLLPSAATDSFSTTEDSAVTTADVLTNDSFGDGPTTITAFDNTSVNGGTIINNGDGTFTYTPATNFNGSDSFTYTITDLDGDASAATVTITVTAVNDVPAAVADSYSAAEDTTVTTGNVLSNDDLGDEPTTITAFDDTSVNGGTVINNGDGTFTYSPATNFNGSDSFTYTITDLDGETSTATVTITVAAVNDVPVALADSYSTEEDSAVTTGNVLSNDDLGDGPATITAFDAVSANGGTVVNNGDETFRYLPAAGFTGTDSFTYTITDQDGESTTATVTLTVAPASASEEEPSPSELPPPASSSPPPETGVPIPGIDDSNSSQPSDDDNGELFPLSESASTARGSMGSGPPAEEESSVEESPGEETPVETVEAADETANEVDGNTPTDDALADTGQSRTQVQTPDSRPRVPEPRASGISGLNTVNKPPLMASPEFLTALDEIRAALEGNAPLDEEHLQVLAAGVTVTGISLTAGSVTWAIRGGSLLTTLLAGIPAWKGFDPLPVVLTARPQRKAREQDKEKDKPDDVESKAARLFEADDEVRTSEESEVKTL